MIKGLTDRAPRLPVIGVLRKGAPKKGSTIGKDLSYFRFTSEEPELLALYEEAYPTEEDKRTLNVLLPYPSADENFESWREKWLAGGLEHRCNGEETVIVRTPSGLIDKDPQPCPGGCKEVGRLTVILPELGRFATVTALTTAVHDIVNLTAQLRAYESRWGDLRKIPFRIYRSLGLVRHGKKSRKMWLLNLEPDPVWAKENLFTLGTPQVVIMTEGPEDEEIAPPDNDEPETPEAPEEAIAPPEEPEATDEPKSPEKPVQGLQGRPYSPQEIKDKAARFISSMKAKGIYHDAETGEPLPAKFHQVGENTPAIISNKLTQAAGGREEYLTFIDWLFAVNSANELTAPQAALIFKLLFNGISAPIDFKTPILEVVEEEIKAVLDYIREPIQDELF